LHDVDPWKPCPVCTDASLGAAANTGFALRFVNETRLLLDFTASGDADGITITVTEVADGTP
jgi:hypothetical protein